MARGQKASAGHRVETRAACHQQRYRGGQQSGQQVLPGEGLRAHGRGQGQDRAGGEPGRSGWALTEHRQKAWLGAGVCVCVCWSWGLKIRMPAGAPSPGTWDTEIPGTEVDLPDLSLPADRGCPLVSSALAQANLPCHQLSLVFLLGLHPSPSSCPHTAQSLLLPGLSCVLLGNH